MCTSRPDDVNPEIDSVIRGALDQAGKHISMNRDKCALCAKAIKIFLEAYGSEAGVVALKFMPFNGM